MVNNTNKLNLKWIKFLFSFPVRYVLYSLWEAKSPLMAKMEIKHCPFIDPSK